MSDNLDFYDEALRNHVCEETPIYNQQTFEQLRQRYPNNEPLTLYRGINFRTQDDYLEFMKNIEHNGGYKARKADSFSPDYETVEDFAKTQPTYFLNEELMAAEQAKSENKERLSGYCGVIVEIQAEKDSVVDISKSKLGVESEAIVKPQSIHDCRIHLIESYKMRVENPEFDINDHLQNQFDKDFDNPFFQYLLLHHKDQFNDESRHLLFNALNAPKNSQPCLDYDERIVYQSDNLEVLKVEEFVHHRHGKRVLSAAHNREATKEDCHIPIFNQALFDQAHQGYFLDSDLEQLSQKANAVLKDFTDFYSQNPDIQWKHQDALIKGITPFCDDDIIEHYQQHALGHKAQEYERLNEQGRDINHLSGKDFENSVKEHKEKLVSFLENLVSELPEKEPPRSKNKPR